MKRYFLGAISLMFMACSSETPEVNVTESVKEKSTTSEADLVSEMQILHETLRSASNGDLNKSNARELMKQAGEFVANYPESESRLQVLKYAEASSRGLGDLNEALRFLKIILDENPEIEKKDQFLSLMAHTYSELGNIDKAKAVYQEIIDTYPESDWAEDAKGNLMTVGKTDEELMEFLKQAN